MVKMFLHIYFTFVITLLVLMSSPASAEATKQKDKCDRLLKAGAKAIIKENNYSKGMKLLRDVLAIANHDNLYKQQFLAINCMGIAYQMNYDYGEALNLFVQARSIANQHLRPSEVKSVLNNIAILYTKDKNYTKANDYFYEAYKLAEQSGDSLRMGMYAVNLGQVNNQIGHIAESQRYCEIARPLIKENLYLSFVNSEVEAANLLKRHHYAQAAARVEQLLENKSLDAYPDVHADLLYILSCAYGAMKEDVKALAAIHRCLDIDTDVEQKIEHLEFCSKLLVRHNCYAKALEYKDRVIHLKDSLDGLRRDGLMAISKVKLDVQDYENNLKIKESQLRMQKYIFLVAVLALFIIALVFYWGLHNRLLRLRQHHEAETIKRRFAEEKLKQQRTESLLKEEQFQRELAQRNAQLAAKAFSLAQLDRQMHDFAETLSNQKFDGNNICGMVKSLLRQVDSSKEWGEFTEVFESLNNNLLAKAKSLHPNLNPMDMRFITYIFMKMSNKEIASMLNVSPDAVRKRKERISKKMDLQGSDLFTYLLQLSSK